MIRHILLSASVIALAACASVVTDAPTSQEDSAPEAKTIETVSAWSHGGMVAAANPYAVEAGVEVLKVGGHAVEAAIAAHAVLSLVEPESSGIGGGAFILVYDHANGEVKALDGRETAPAYVTPKQFYDENGELRNYITSWQSGLSVGVPSSIALYEMAWEKYGKVEWASLFDYAINLSTDGFEVNSKMAGYLASDRLRQFVQLDDHPVTAAYFYPNGEPLKEGDIRDNPEYAATLKAIAEGGAEAFYTGDIAEAIVEATNAEPLGGAMTLEDLANYEPIEREAVCGEAMTYSVCAPPPPSSGGTTLNAFFGLYERMVSDLDEGDSDGRLKAFVDAQRIAYADRDHYVADMDAVFVPVDDLYDPAYLDARVKDRFAPDAKPTAGDPGEVLRGEPLIGMWGRDKGEDSPGTTHISIIDTYGNAVSMTASVESVFGSSRWAGGFLLNNQLTDFAREAEKNGKPLANAPAAGKRPRSSMSPTIVFDEEGDLFMVTGSPGGNSIIAYNAKTLAGIIDWDLSVEEAIAYPNIIARGETVGVETSAEGGDVIGQTLTDMGYNVKERSGENSGLHVIVVREDGLEGGADPRRKGEAVAVPAAE